MVLKNLFQYFNISQVLIEITSDHQRILHIIFLFKLSVLKINFLLKNGAERNILFGIDLKTLKLTRNSYLFDQI